MIFRCIVVPILFISTTLSAAIDKAALDELNIQVKISPHQVMAQIHEMLENKSISTEDELNLLLIKTLAFKKIGQLSEKLALSQSIYERAKIEQYTDIIAKAKFEIADSHMLQGNFSQSLTDYQESVILFEALNDQINLSYALTGMGNAHAQLGKLEVALEVYIRALRLTNTLENPQGIGNLNNSIGALHFWLGDFPKAIEFYKQAIEYEIPINDLERLSMYYTNLGEAYTEIKEYVLAMGSFEAAIEIIKKSPSARAEAGLHKYLGNLKLKMGKP